MTVGVACCQLKPQLCSGCGEPYPDECLEVLYADSLDLYCPSCVFDAQKRHDAQRDYEFYGE